MNEYLKYMEGVGLQSSMSRAVANAWCFSLRLGLGAGGPHKWEVCSGPGAELQVEELQGGGEQDQEGQTN